ncbi:MAG: hypothetical protein ABI647_04275 [Gemmatimonadota bacterium]
MHRLLLRLMLIGSFFGRGAVAQTPARGSVDWARLADAVVNRTLKVEKGDRVVFFWDRASDRGMAAALRAAITRAGGSVVEIEAPSEAADNSLTGAARARRDSTWAATFAGAQAAIWLPTPIPGGGNRPFEHLVERSKVRSIHFHWFLPPDAGDAPRIEAMYSAAILVPPADILARITKVEKAVRGATVHITAPNGTDLMFEVPKDAWVHRNSGDASRAKTANARSVRDREEELPASVFRTTDLRNASGTIVGYNSFDTRGPTLKVTFDKGRVKAFTSVKGAEEVVTRWQAATGDKDVPGEFVIGTNPALAAVLPSGFMPYYGYGAGVVRVAIGDNWESGGKNRSSNGEVLLFLPNATVTAGGVVVVKDGVLK